MGDDVFPTPVASRLERVTYDVEATVGNLKKEEV